MDYEKLAAIAIDREIHDELKTLCDEQGWRLGTTASKILKQGIKEVKKKIEDSFF